MRKKAKGVTLIELIMVIVIVGVLVSVSSMYIKETISLWQFLSFRNEVVSRARMALIRMTREIRGIANSRSVNSASSSVFNFTDSVNNTITYSLSGSNVMRNSDILVQGVTNFTFTYYNSTDGVIAIPQLKPNDTDIRRIKIRLNVADSTQNKTLEAQIYPRNFQ